MHGQFAGFKRMSLLELIKMGSVTENETSSSRGARDHPYDIVVTPSEEFRAGSPFPKRPRRIYRRPNPTMGVDRSDQSQVQLQNDETKISSKTPLSTFSHGRHPPNVDPKASTTGSNPLQFGRRSSRNPLFLPNINAGKPLNEVHHSVDYVNKNAGDDVDNNNCASVKNGKKIGKTFSCNPILSMDPKSASVTKKLDEEVEDVQETIESVRGDILCTTSSSDSWETITEESDTDTETELPTDDCKDKPNSAQEELKLASSTPPAQQSSADLQFLFINQNFTLQCVEPSGEYECDPGLVYLAGTDSIANQLEFDLNSNFKPFSYSHSCDLVGEDRQESYIVDWTEEDDQREKEKTEVQNEVIQEQIEDEAASDTGHENNGSHEMEADQRAHQGLDDNENFKAAASSSKFRGFLEAINNNWKKFTNGATLLRKQSSENLLKLKNFFNRKLTRSTVGPNDNLVKDRNGLPAKFRGKKYDKVPLTCFDRLQIPETRKRASIVRQVFVRKTDFTEIPQPQFETQFERLLVPLDNFLGSSTTRKRVGDIRTMLMRVEK